MELHLLGKMRIPKDIEYIIRTLNVNQYEAFIVGGACRDFILGKDPKDFDIATSATPEQIKNLFPSAVTGGNSFCVSFVNAVEVATYRKDRADHAEIANTLEEDVIRRDFTMNALAYSPISCGFEDYVGGLEDLQNRTLRFVGEPERRIIEDPVRILRGIRFASVYNLRIEKETYFEMFRLRHLLKDIPKERILLEVTKAFKSNNTHRFLTLLEEMEMLEYVFPSMVELKNIDGGGYHAETVRSHCFNAVKAIEDKHWLLKLAALYHDVGKQNGGS
jgi:tRNA nucleotidyltransferase (CCA-adding enzyme)